MKQKLLFIASILGYLGAFIIAILYFLSIINPRIFIDVEHEFIYVAFFTTFLYIGSLLLSKYKQNNKPMQIFLKIIFAVYIIVMINLTLFAGFRNNGSFITIFTYLNKLDFIKETVNLIPFNTVMHFIKGFLNDTLDLSIVFYNLIGNIICLMPLGLFLPRIFKKFKKFRNYALAVFLASLFIETSQLLTVSGYFDIDDIILNTLGALIVFPLFNKGCLKELICVLMLEKKKKEIEIKKLIGGLIIVLAFLLLTLGIKIMLDNNTSGYSIEFIDESTECYGDKEIFYEDDNYILSFDCPKSDKVYILFDGKDKYSLKDMLNNNYDRKYNFEIDTLIRLSKDIKVEVKKTELTVYYQNNGLFSYKIEDESIFKINIKQLIDKGDGTRGIYMLLDGLKAGTTYVTFEVSNPDTSEREYIGKYKMTVNESLKVNYEKID
ncbi:MAG: VanZ family protein [Ruminococcus sp.]|nr:VanZ family protein [Ruminococcus sp.]